MSKRGLIIVFLLILISGCSNNTDNSINVEKECETYQDCIRAGCSNHLCVTKEKAEDLFTTCEFREEYNCLKVSICGCYDGKCGWEENYDYLTCLEGVKR